MIVTRAPMRISFVGGGTDLPSFYTRYPGRVISTAIDKFMHVVINRTPFVDKISARYDVSEVVSHPRDLKHSRIREALLDLDITKGIQIASFPMIPAKTGLGSSSTFSVAMIKGLYAFQGKRIDKYAVAEAAARLEIKLVGEPIGKQDQYAASFGGLNVFQFNPDHSVEVRPILLGYKNRLALEDHLLVFFTGITRDASSVLSEQNNNIEVKFESLKKMSDSVLDFEGRLMKGDLRGLGQMLHEGWMIKKTLASNISNKVIDDLYDVGMNTGAWGGKVLGAGGGGCVMFLVSPEKRKAVLAELVKLAQKNNLIEAKEVPIRFAQSGAEILHDSSILT